MKIASFTPLEKSYPQKLRDLTDPPSQIFIKGKFLPRDDISVAIVGSRIASEYGKKISYKFAYELAKVNVTIVSGLARGIDTVVHSAALDAGGRTIAVLGSGLDVIYPPENKALFEKITKSGAVITEYPSGTMPLRHHFLERNRLIAALAKVVIVVEGKRRSGTLSTARLAAELGREVFAVPGPINSPLSEAPLYLIEQGASIAKKPEDILELLF